MHDPLSRLLVIEDNRSVAVWLSTLFRRFGFAVAVAADGLIGLSMAHEQRPGVIVMDYHLPDVDGRVVLERLRLECPRSQLSIVMVSGDTEIDVEPLLEAGLDAFLPKHADGLLLLSTVRTVLENRTTNQRAAEWSRRLTV